MAFHCVRRAGVAALGTLLLLTSCSTEPPAAIAAANATAPKVDRLIVRYDLGAPPATDGGQPWGSQCVAGDYTDRLERGRWIGAGMRIIHIDPSVSPKVGRRIAAQMEQCPYIEWAEADDTRLSVPSEDLLSG